MSPVGEDRHSCGGKVFLLGGVFVSMAKHRRSYPKRGAYALRRVRIQSGFSYGALAAADVATGPLTVAGTGTYRCISIDLNWSLTNLAAGVDADGVEFGVAHSDYSAAEVEECLESFASIDVGDKIAAEQSGRLVRQIGVISAGGATTAHGIQWNDGRSVKTRLNWLMSIGDFLNVWVRNGSGAVYTTGTTIASIGNMWVKDSV